MFIHIKYKKITEIMFPWLWCRIKSQLEETIVKKQPDVWSEYNDNIWKEDHLKHLRDAATDYPTDDSISGLVFDPSQGKYGEYGFETWVTGEELGLSDSEEDLEITTAEVQSAPKPDPKGEFTIIVCILCTFYL